MYYKQDENKMYQAQTIVVNKQKEAKLFHYCEEQCHAAKLLRNATIFRGRQLLFAYNKDYKNLKDHQIEVIDEFNTYTSDKYEKISKEHYLPYSQEFEYLYKKSNNPDYFNPILTAQTRTRVVKQAMEDFSSFFKSAKKYYTDNTNYTGKPNYPKYTKSETITVDYSNQDCAIYEINNITYLKLPHMKKNKNAKIKPKKWGYINLGKLKIGKLMNLKISPYYDTYKISLVYEIEKSNHSLDNTRILGLDPGLNNFLTSSNNCGLSPFIINGRDMKSYNQHYNERLAYLRSRLHKNQYTSKQIKRLSKERDCYFNNKFHKIINYIMNYCIKNNIGTIVIGHNKLQKQNYNNGKIQNQHFCFMPNFKFLKMFKLKCVIYNLNIIETEESYTSQASFLDMDNIPTYKKGKNNNCQFNGKRTYRGLFESKDAICINADVNGASNIIRKVFPNAFDNIKDFTYLIKTVTKITIK